eukprot:scaffold1912_cov135-Cylindrotheca_fusiformis.AAC.9
MQPVLTHRRHGSSKFKGLRSGAFALNIYCVRYDMAKTKSVRLPLIPVCQSPLQTAWCFQQDAKTKDWVRMIICFVDRCWKWTARRRFETLSANAVQPLAFLPNMIRK